MLAPALREGAGLYRVETDLLDQLRDGSLRPLVVSLLPRCCTAKMKKD